MKKVVYDVMKLPFGDKYFEEQKIATCKTRYLAQCVIGMQHSICGHTYRIVEKLIEK